MPRKGTFTLNIYLHIDKVNVLFQAIRHAIEFVASITSLLTEYKQGVSKFNSVAFAQLTYFTINYMMFMELPY